MLLEHYTQSGVKLVLYYTIVYLVFRNMLVLCCQKPS